MEYLAFRGEHDDVPLAEMLQAFETLYPSMSRLDRGDFDADVAREVAAN
jgi:hypothetical protein